MIFMCDGIDATKFWRQHAYSPQSYSPRLDGPSQLGGGRGRGFSRGRLLITPSGYSMLRPSIKKRFASPSAFVSWRPPNSIFGGWFSRNGRCGGRRKAAVSIQSAASPAAASIRPFSGLKWMAASFCYARLSAIRISCLPASSIQTR